MTGGALGSLFAQLIHLSSAERKTLLVAGNPAVIALLAAMPAGAGVYVLMRNGRR